MLVPIRADDGFVLDIRYATDDNLTGKPIYLRPVALLLPQAAAPAARRPATCRRPGSGDQGVRRLPPDRSAMGAVERPAGRPLRVRPAPRRRASARGRGRPHAARRRQLRGTRHGHRLRRGDRGLGTCQPRRIGDGAA